MKDCNKGWDSRKQTAVKNMPAEEGRGSPKKEKQKFLQRLLGVKAGDQVDKKPPGIEKGGTCLYQYANPELWE